MILADIEAVAGDSIDDKILANIKNTMPDWHIVEKKFNGLLEDYRQEILPSVVDGWDTLPEEEQLNLSSLNNFLWHAPNSWHGKILTLMKSHQDMF